MNQLQRPSCCRRPLSIGLWICMLATLVGGCRTQGADDPQVEEKQQTVTLRLLVIDDPSVGSEAQRRWQAEGRGVLEVVNRSSADLRDSDFAIPGDFDAILYPERIHADLLDRQMLLEIPPQIWNSEDVNKNDLLSHYRGSLLREGDRYYGLPLSGRSLVMIYRRDCLAALQVSPPKTWNEFDELVLRLKNAEDLRDSDGASLPTALALPLQGHWAAHLFLARTAASVRSVGKLSTLFQIESMQPLISGEPFQQSLQSLRELVTGQESVSIDSAPQDVYRRMLAGDAAIGFGWPAGDGDLDNAPAAANLGISRLPGSPRWFDATRHEWIERAEGEPIQVDYLGAEQRVVSVLRNSLHANDALSFVGWLCNKTNCQQLAAHSQASGPVRSSQLVDVSRWAGDRLDPAAADQLAQAIQEAHQSKLILTFPRIAERDEYLQVLATAVRQCLRGEGSAADELAKASSAWDALTERIGMRKQRDFLRGGEGF